MPSNLVMNAASDCTEVAASPASTSIARKINNAQAAQGVVFAMGDMGDSRGGLDQGGSFVRHTPCGRMLFNINEPQNSVNTSCFSVVPIRRVRAGLEYERSGLSESWVTSNGMSPFNNPGGIVRFRHSLVDRSAAGYLSPPAQV